MTRFHLASIAAGLVCLLAIAFDSIPLVLADMAALLLLMGLGVAIPQLRFFGPYICRGSATGRRVALTFDDGPDPRSTPALLDLLRERGVTATFFCVGQNVDANRELTARITREGHLVENHTYTHNDTTNFFTEARLRDELSRTQEAIESAGGTAPQFFRPPVGLSNPRVFRAAGLLHLKVVGWTIRSLDTRITEPTRVVQRVVRGLRPGAIILLHDGNIPAARVAPTVKLLLDSLRESGYEVVRLDQLLT